MEIGEVEIDFDGIDFDGGDSSEADARAPKGALVEKSEQQNAGLNDAEPETQSDVPCPAKGTQPPSPGRPPTACRESLPLSLDGVSRADDGDADDSTASERRPELTNSMAATGLVKAHAQEAKWEAPQRCLERPPSGLGGLVSTAVHQDSLGRKQPDPAARRQGPGDGEARVEEDPALMQLLNEKLDALNAAERPKNWLELDGDYLDDDIGSDIERFSREELLAVLAVSKLPWGSDPQKFKCPYCQIQDYSANHWEHTCLNYLFSALLCASGCCLGCCLVPMCMDWLKNTKHVCTNCHRVVGYRRACAPFHDGKHAVCCCGLLMCCGRPLEWIMGKEGVGS